jgi:hypothetical protein
MSGEEERVERLTEEVEKLRETLVAHTALLQQYIPYFAVLAKWAKVVGFVKPFLKPDIVFADPHGSWDGHLPGAYDEGQQIKNVLVSEGHTATMIRHPVSKSDFLTNLSNKNIVHLAGHGGFGGGQVYFCFDDGNIYPSDIASSGSAPGLLLYAGVCLGGKNDTMASAFRGKGTKYYVGFTQTIPDWGAKHFDDLVYHKWLVEGKDLRIALDEADDSYPDLRCWVLWE